MSGSTSVAPLAAKLAKGYLKAQPGAASFRLLRAARTSASPTSPRGRVTIGNSSRDPKPHRSGRPRVQQDRPRRDLHRHQHRATRLPDLDAGAGPGDLRRRVRELEPGAGRDHRAARSTSSSAPRPRVPRTRSRRSSWAARRSQLEREPEGLERPRRSSRSSRDPNAIGYVSLAFTKGVHTRPLQGRRLHPAQRQVRPVRRRPQLLHGHPRRADRAPREVDHAGSSRRRAAQQIIATELGSAQLG